MLDIRVPEIEQLASGNKTLLLLLLEQWTSYLGYFISFLHVGVFWANHHNMFFHIKRANHFLMLLNTLFLMFIALIPFAAALLAKYIDRPEQRTVVSIYVLILAMSAILFNLIWLYAKRMRFLKGEVNSTVIKAMTQEYLISIPLYAFSFILAFSQGAWGLVGVVLIFLFYTFPRPNERKS